MAWVLAFHIIFVVCWFAGLFYLPRLYVYHAEADDRISIDRFKVMERRLFWGIMTPAGLLATISGGWYLLAYWSVYNDQVWFHFKMVLVLVLWAFHGYCWLLLRHFKEDHKQHSSTFYRWINEIPTVLLIAIVILAVVRP